MRRLSHIHPLLRSRFAFISFFLLLGSVGALEHGNITMTQGIVQMLLFIGAAALFTWLAGGFDNEE